MEWSSASIISISGVIMMLLVAFYQRRGTKEDSQWADIKSKVSKDECKEHRLILEKDSIEYRSRMGKESNNHRDSINGILQTQARMDGKLDVILTEVQKSR